MFRLSYSQSGLSAFMICHRICSKRNATDAPIGTGTANPSGAPDFTPSFCGIRVHQSLVFCAMFCKSLFVLFLLAIVFSVLLLLAIVLSVLFLLAIVLSVHRFTPYVYLIGIFKLFSDIYDIRNRSFVNKTNDTMVIAVLTVIL
jgi:hypothetical protein